MDGLECVGHCFRAFLVGTSIGWTDVDLGAFGLEFADGFEDDVCFFGLFDGGEAKWVLFFAEATGVWGVCGKGEYVLAENVKNEIAD